MRSECRRGIICLVFLFSAGVGRAASPTLTELHGFSGPDGYQPEAPLLQASDGNFYGTTYSGGNDGSGCVQGCAGTVFKITSQGQFTVLHTFIGGGTTPAYQNGRNPWGGLVEGPDGYLYGTTFVGGVAIRPSDGATVPADGTVYKISKTGLFQKIHDFNSYSQPEGGEPQGSLVFGGDGYLYGTTTNPPAFPQVFRMSSTGVYTTVKSLYNTGFGTPQNGLVQASDGNLYGVAAGGIYRVTPPYGFSAVYFFVPASDGNGYSELIQAADGNLYGATSPGPGNSGSVFRISLTGNYQRILSLIASTTGTYPNALMQASDGNLWGTTDISSGSTAAGRVYTISTNGTLLQSMDLAMQSTGFRPTAPLIQGTDGKLYGTTSSYGGLPNGSPASGTLFVVDAGLSTRVIGLAGNLAFGNTPVATVTVTPLTITNSGNSTLTINSISYPSGFSGDWAGGTISAGGLQTVGVLFAPTATTSYGGAIVVNGDQTSGTGTIAASGTGVASSGTGQPGLGGGSLPVSYHGAPAPTHIIKVAGSGRSGLPFGKVHLGSTSTRTLTITNAGTSALTVSTITYPAGFSGDWNGGTIGPGSSQKVTVSFAPIVRGIHVGTLKVVADQTEGADAVIVSGSAEP